MGNKIAFTADQHLCTVQYGMRQRYLDFMDALRAFGSEVERGPAQDDACGCCGLLAGGAVVGW